MNYDDLTLNFWDISEAYKIKSNKKSRICVELYSSELIILTDNCHIDDVLKNITFKTYLICEIAGILAKVTSPKFTEDEIGLLLTKALERRSVSKEDIVAISEMQKALREGNKNFGSGKNE